MLIIYDPNIYMEGLKFFTKHILFQVAWISLNNNDELAHILL